MTGRWWGDCYGDISGKFELTVSEGGEVTGSFWGDDEGRIAGSVNHDGKFEARGTGSAGGSFGAETCR